MHETDDDIIELLLIPKVGRARARALYAAGFTSASDIAKADPKRLAAIPGIGPEMAKSIIRAAGDMVSAKPDTDDPDTAKEILICPMCGSMVGAGSSVCQGCGIAFSDEVDEIAPAAEDRDAAAKPGEPENDGFWYRDRGKLFICPECGSLVSDGSQSCPKCGVFFDEEEEADGEPVAPAKPAEGPDGYWYKDDSGLFMCPNCGSFIKKDAEGCSNCGIVFEEGEEPAEEPVKPAAHVCPMCGSEVAAETAKCTECGFEFTREAEPDGFWYKQSDALFMCPSCGSFIPKNATACGKCGTVLEEDEEAEHEPAREPAKCPMCKSIVPVGSGTCGECGFELSREEEKDGFWYKDSVSLFICPNCGAFLSDAADMCMNCGLVFEGEEEDSEPAPSQPAGKPLEAAVRDKDLEKSVDELIELVEIEDELDSAAELAPPAAAKEDAAPLADDVKSALPAESLYLCPICGAFVQSGLLNCPSCGAVFDDIGELELEPVGSVTGTAEQTAELAREMAEEIAEIEAELLAPPRPKEEKKGGVSKDFLDRWKKLDTAADRHQASKADKADYVSAKDAEIAQGLEDMLISSDEGEKESAGASVDGSFSAARARELAAQGRVDEAVSHLDRAAEIEPDRELEYKRLMLELMGVQPAEAKVDISDIAEIDDIGELSIDKDALAEGDRTRLKEIDSLLAEEPESNALWQEKGEVLERLGRHEEAVTCFDRSIGLTYAELRKESKEPGATRILPIGIGLTNGEGRVNGRVNGLLTQRGLVNGDSAGRINGLTNGRGRINGMVNGLARGRVNGRVNGLTNGRTNGRGLVNGRTNGRSNGLPGRVNGGGMINGRGNGLINGGLVNGMGLVNGEALIDGSGSFRRLKARRRERIRWRYRLTAMVLFVTLVLMISMLGNLMVDERDIMSIDGDFSDWEGIDSYYNFISDEQLDPDITILETRFAAEGDRLNLYIVFAGEAFAGSDGGVSSLLAFIDTDPDMDTGYSVDGMGADLVAEIYGWDGSIRGSGLSRFGAGAERDDWNGFSVIGSVTAYQRGSAVEAGFTVPRDMAEDLENAEVRMVSMNSEGDLDMTDYVMSGSSGGMVAAFYHLGADIINPGEGITLGRLALSSHSDAEGEFTGIAFNITGEGTTEDIANPVLTDADGNTVPADLTETGTAGFRLAFSEPVAPGLNTTMLLTLEADIRSAAAGKALGIELAGADGSAGLPAVRNRQSRMHNIGTPDRLRTDGAFGDWETVSVSADAANDVTGRNPNATFINANVDLAEARLAIQQDGAGAASLYYEFAVNGVMLGGDSVPTVRYRPEPVTEPTAADSDRDGVPNNIDPHPYDFSNDGVTDERATTPAGLPDVDGDGTADYPEGQDWWLNTTIPANFPDPYAGRPVSIYIGPVESVHAENLGDDRAYILIDADGDILTGVDLRGGFGIDYTVVISGKDNRIIASEIYMHDPASQPTGWAFVGNATAAVDWTRAEGSLELAQMGITPGENFSVRISAEDWKGNTDSEGTLPAAEIPAPYPMAGTRSPAGNNVVINEIAPNPNPEWVELCNPTASPINIGGWRIYATNNLRYTFPAGTTIGAWGSGSEYLVAAMTQSNRFSDTGELIRLTTATGTEVDRTAYTAVPNGQTWSRFKNATYGMPTDTDSAADFYISAAPTRGAPNDRTAPAITVSKTGDRSYAVPGDSVVYTLWYNNTGEGNARHVWVNDTLPAGMTYVSSSDPYTSVAGQLYSWHFTNVAPGMHSLTITAAVNAGVPAGTVLTNSVQLRYTDQLSRPWGTSSDTWAVTVQVPPPSFSLVKTAANPSVLAGSDIDFTIHYNNTGAGTASHVWLNDTLPAGLTYVAASPAPSSVSGQSVFWYFQNIAPGNYQLTVTAQAGIGLAPGTVLTNAVSCDYKDPAGVSIPRVNAQASVTVASPAALIILNEIAPNPNPEWIELCNPTSSLVDIGGWRIYASNFLRYTFPAGTTIGAWGSGSEYIVATMTQNNRFSNAGELVRLTTGTAVEVDRTTYIAVADGQTWSRLKDADTGKPVDTGATADWYISNNAWLVTEGPTPAAPNDRKRPVMGIEKSASLAAAEPGQDVTFTIWYNNTGDGNAKDVWMNDTLPAGLIYVGASIAPLSVTGQNIVWYFGTVVHDSVNSLTLTARMNAVPADGDTVTNNVAMVYHDALKRPMGTDTDTADVTCSRAEITVEKVANVAQTTAGGTVVYTVYYNNTGSASAGSVWINDTLPAGVTFGSASIAPDSVIGLTLSWHMTNVAPGAHSITVTVTVNETAGGGTLTNWAFLSYASGYGWALGTSSASATVIIPEMQHLVVPVLGITILGFIAIGKRRKTHGKDD